MPGENDKTVRLQFVVDQASVQAAKKAMGELIVEATKLANVLKSASLGGGSVLGGGGVGAGGLNPQQTIAKNAASGPSGGISGGATEAAKSIVLMGRNTKDTFQGVTDAVKRNLNDQGRDVDAFSRKVSGLNRELAALKQHTGGAGYFVDQSGRMGGDGGTTASTGGGARPPGGGGLVDQFGRPMMAAAAGGAMAAGAGGGGAPPSGTTAAVESAGGGVSPGVMQAIRKAVIIGAAVRAVGIGTDIADVYANAPGARARVEAQRGSIFGSEYQRAYGRDYTTGLTSMAMEGRLRGFERYKTMADAIADDARAATTNISTSMRAGAGALSGLVTGNAGSAQTGYDVLLSGQGADIAANIQQKRLADLRGQFEQGAGLPMEVAMRQFQANSGRNMSMATQLGFGGRVTGLGKGVTQAQGYDLLRAGAPGVAYQDQLAGLQGKLGIYTPEEYASAVGGLRSSVGGAFGMGGLVMGAQASGGGFAGLGGLASQVAIGGRGADFLRATMGMNTGMGINSAAAMGIGSAVGGTLTGGGIATSGLGALAALQAGFGGGTGGPGDLMMARQAQAGLGAFGGVMGGGLDKYQTAMNFITAGNAFKGTGFAAQGRLSEIFGQNPSLAADIMAGGPIPPQLRALGVTSKEQVAQYVSDTSKGVIARATNVMGNETSAGRLINSIQAGGGDIQGYMKAHGIRRGTKAFNEFRTDLGAGLALSQGIDFAAGEGEAAGLMGIGSKGLKKGSVGAIRDAAREATAEDNKVISNQLKATATQMGTFLNAIKETKTAQDTFGHAITDMSTSAKEVQDAFDIAAVAALKWAAIVNPDAKKDIDKFMDQYHHKDANEKAKPAGPGVVANAKGGYGQSGAQRMKGK